jgi:hypothetical protein
MPLDIDNSTNLPDHMLDVFTSLADLQAYVSLKHAITIMGFNVDVYLPQESTGTQAHPLHDRGDGSLYSGEPYIGAYNPDFTARIALTNPQGEPVVRGTEVFVNEQNKAYTLKNTTGARRNYCPGDIALHSKLVIAYGGSTLNYFVDDIHVLRNPNASSESDESMIFLDLDMHVHD